MSSVCGRVLVKINIRNKRIVGYDRLYAGAEFAAACGKMRPSGKAPPQRLTTTQLRIVQRLVDAHGDDVQVNIKPTAWPGDSHHLLHIIHAQFSQLCRWLQTR